MVPPHNREDTSRSPAFLAYCEEGAPGRIDDKPGVGKAVLTDVEHGALFSRKFPVSFLNMAGAIPPKSYVVLSRVPNALVCVVCFVASAA